MSEEKAEGLKGTVTGWVKAVVTSIVGLLSGAFLMYLTPVVNNAIKPARPLANFATQVNGLTVNFNNRSTGGVQGWWDFGDGTALEPFDPKVNNITHTYAKPGPYNVKLLLQNLLGEDGDRTAPVILEADSKSANSSKPEITQFELKSFSSDRVPAGYTLECNTKNTGFCLLFHGDDRPMEILDVAALNGHFLRYEQMGAFTVRLVAVNGKEFVEQTRDVYVGGGSDGDLVAKLTASYDAVKVERKEKDWSFSCGWQADPRDSVSPVRRERLADPGCTFVSAALVNTDDLDSPLRSAKVEISPDKKKVTLTGELVKSASWLASPAQPPSCVTKVKVVMDHRSAVQNFNRGELPMPVEFNTAMKIPTQPPGTDWQIVRKQVKLELWDGGRKAWSGTQGITNMKMSLSNQTCYVTALPQDDYFLLKVDAPVAPAPIAVVTPIPTPITTTPSPRVGPIIRPASFERNPLLPRRPMPN